MTKNKISDTGIWISNDDSEHCFCKSLSEELISIIKTNKVESIYDLGCGTGEYLYNIKKEIPSIEATGIEGYQVDGLLYNNIIARDLSVPLDLPSADMAISIEVGEHIPAEFEDVFLDNVSNSATKTIVISWAIPGQGGLGHVNCQPNEFVIEGLQARGWKYNKQESLRLRQIDLGDAVWLANTLMVFYK